MAGGYTSVQIPFTPSYTVAGTVTNTEGDPVAGARVEAISINGEKKVLSITSGAGIFFLEGLSQGTYNLTIYGEPATPSILEINQNSETFFEFNLTM